MQSSPSGVPADIPILVRAARSDDFRAVAGLLAELGRPAITPPTADRVRAAFERHVASREAASLIAERGAEPIGFLAMHFRHRLGQPLSEAWIPDFIVTEREHGQGVARALVTRAIELARQQGCYRVVLESYYHRARAHRFYLREGFTDAGKCFVLPLAPPAEC